MTIRIRPRVAVAVVVGVGVLGAAGAAFGGSPHRQNSSSSTLLLNPPREVFTFPASVVGQVTWGPNGEPRTALVEPVPGTGSSSQGLYTWDIMDSTAEARTKAHDLAARQAAGCVGPGSACSPMGLPPAPLAARPAGGWVYGGFFTVTANGSSYLYSGVASFHNLVFSVDASCQIPQQPHDGCLGWTAATLQRLVDRAQEYAAQGDGPPPAPTPILPAPTSTATADGGGQPADSYQVMVPGASVRPMSTEQGQVDRYHAPCR